MNISHWALSAFGAVAAAFACSSAPPPAAQTADHAPSHEVAMKRVLIALTSHDKKGTTSGEPTGAYLPEIAHPHAVFVAAG
ncbi:MAG TPA: hypothetical protein VER04_05565, partial [Polyangiaceae bacterium]|nr:hypothetical protein [Polyangiaceae bacterium]